MPHQNENRPNPRGMAIESDLSDVRVNVGKIETKIESLEEMVKTLVSRSEFTPVKIIVYGMVGSVMAGVLGALLSLIIRK